MRGRKWLRIVYTNVWQGNVCMEYVSDDASQPIIRYAVLEKNSKFVEYDLDQDDIDENCNAAAIDLTNAADKELRDLDALTSH